MRNRIWPIIEQAKHRNGRLSWAKKSTHWDHQTVKTIDLLLEETGLSIAELAQRSQLSPQRVEAILSGRWLPSPAERGRLAEIVGLPVDEIGWGHSMAPRNVRYQRFGLKENF
jgi:transcriptional regulator with XRE-family HTH domain